jgi:hypothetical protein
MACERKAAAINYKAAAFSIQLQTDISIYNDQQI